jgi:hypothetical protein
MTPEHGYPLGALGIWSLRIWQAVESLAKRLDQMLRWTRWLPPG